MCVCVFKKAGDRETERKSGVGRGSKRQRDREKERLMSFLLTNPKAFQHAET